MCLAYAEGDGGIPQTGYAPVNVRPRGPGGGGGGRIGQTILAQRAGIRQEMNTQGAGNSTYFVLLHDVKTSSGCPGEGN